MIDDFVLTLTDHKRLGRGSTEIHTVLTIAARSPLPRSVPEVTLRIRLSPFAKLRHLRKVYPAPADMGDHRRAGPDGSIDVDTGEWPAGMDHEYSVCVEVGTAGLLNEDLRAGRIDVYTGDERRAVPAVLLVRRVDEDHRPGPTGYSLREELSRAIGAGCRAYAADRHADAEAAFARAVEIAVANGDQEMLTRLARVVSIKEGEPVRLRPDAGASDLLLLGTASQFSQIPPELRPVPGPDLHCLCGRISPPNARFCEACGASL